MNGDIDITGANEDIERARCLLKNGNAEEKSLAMRALAHLLGIDRFEDKKVEDHYIPIKNK